MLSNQVCINTLRSSAEGLSDDQLVTLLLDIIDVQLRDETGGQPFRNLGDQSGIILKDLHDMIDCLERSMMFSAEKDY